MQLCLGLTSLLHGEKARMTVQNTPALKGEIKGHFCNTCIGVPALFGDTQQH